MREILNGYQMNATTWIYLSSLIMIAVFFKFRRFWSVRNLDLIGLIAFAPGLLLDAHGHLQVDYLWLFAVGGFFLLRLLLDVLMVRRPLLEPNLSASGLTFAGAAMLVFLIANVVTPDVRRTDVEAAVWMDKMMAREDAPEVRKYLSERGPGYPMFHVFSAFSDEAVKPADDTAAEQYHRAQTRVAATRSTAVLAHLAIVLGMILIGYRHFDNIHTGVAAAMLYLLVPYTANCTPRVDHVVPAALLVWAVQSYRRPVVSGMFMGLAAGLTYFPLFLLPLWCSFYWRRGLVRFMISTLVVLALMAAMLSLYSDSWSTYVAYLRQMFGLQLANPTSVTGFWASHREAFRYTVLAAFVAMCAGMALWPAQKNLGTLLGCSAAVMLGVQFWKAQDGGIFMAWYLPLLILTIFRPNLEDRIALSAITEGWIRWRKGTLKIGG